MAESLWGGGVGGYLRQVTEVRIPHIRTDPKSRPMVRPWIFIVIALAVYVGTLMAFLGLGYGPAAMLFSGMFAAPIALVWFRPMIGWALSLMPLLVLLPADRIVFNDYLDPFSWLLFQAPVQLPVIYAFALSAPRRVCYPAVVITLITEALSQLNSEFGGGVFQSAALLVLATMLAVVLGRFRVHRRTARVRIAEEEGMRQVLEERTRLARELHDVVAHHMSVIAVQASTAPYRLDPGRPEVDREFQAIGSSAREALQELRQVLDVLRGSESAPTPGLNDLPKLIESTRLAGVPVRMIMNGSTLVPAPEVQYAAYRIVQEGLSNVIKHAPGAETAVWIAVRTAGVAIDVINERPPARSGPPNPSGHGLIGMRERAEAVGGTLLVGPTDRGGFQLRAALPTCQT
ncbi:sensor histidine kinase [Microlunatus speluncae]|uniref:sensor histidine kinase n=1 Tax=Microlunatus speluncae TaxID=2594267 RepID=UPI001266450B|nr:sensor histidine kinase [Microlunatus speluncae]